MKVKMIPLQKLNLEALGKEARKINQDSYRNKLIEKGADRGWIIPNHGFFDQGMQHIVNGRTHGGRGFIKNI